MGQPTDPESVPGLLDPSLGIDMCERIEKMPDERVLGATKGHWKFRACSRSPQRASLFCCRRFASCSHMRVIDHYRDVLRRVAWLDALCWIVVQPLGEDLGLDDVLWRVNGGGDPERRVMAYPPEEALEADEPVLFAFEGDSAWGLLEFTYGYGLSDQVLATVSEGARVWMASWHFKGGHTVVYAADGRIRARMREFVFGDHREEEDDPSALAGLRTLLDGLARDDFDGKRAAVFAFTEQITGVGFDADQLLAENVPVIVLDVPRP